MRSLALLIAVPLMATAAVAQAPDTKTQSSQSSKSGQGATEGTMQGRLQSPMQGTMPGTMPGTMQGVMQGLMNEQAMQMQMDLQQEGFSDIRVMPRSFLVRAKDKQGNPVMMIINPDSLTAFTKVPANNTTTGQAGAVSQGSDGGSPGSSPESSPVGK